MEVATRDEIQLGKATILCSLDNKNVQEYEIEIEKIFKENNYDNKSMEIKVTDERLLEKTGGIIQGMSGSPIIQNGKFIGAVTHVLVNNPEKGYAVFGDIMLKQARGIRGRRMIRGRRKNHFNEMIFPPSPNHPLILITLDQFE